MEPIVQITGRGMPLRRSDVDTDQIIPAAWLKKVERTGFGEGLFEAWRKDPEFVLNDARYAEATILVAGPNFGTGSSREHAVWALTDYGFRAIVSPRFADIFRNNSTKAGLVPVQVSAEAVERLQGALDDDPGLLITVDVKERRLRAEAIDLDEPFPLDDFTHYRLLEGLDDIGITLQHAASIDAYERERRPLWLPVTTSA